jgi:hypothetical protein
MALQKAEAKINDGFGFSIWISTHSLVDRNLDDDSHYCSAYWRNNHLCYICIISNPIVFEMTKQHELRTKGKIDLIDATH